MRSGVSGLTSSLAGAEGAEESRECLIGVCRVRRLLACAVSAKANVSVVRYLAGEVCRFARCGYGCSWAPTEVQACVIPDDGQGRGRAVGWRGLCDCTTRMNAKLTGDSGGSAAESEVFLMPRLDEALC
jgi:hypothetical protein